MKLEDESSYLQHFDVPKCSKNIKNELTITSATAGLAVEQSHIWK
jgi:hypothetical protein